MPITSLSESPTPILLPTPQVEIDHALQELQAHKHKWIATTILERIRLLTEMGQAMVTIAEPWVAISLAAKRFPVESMAEAEEWLFLAAIFRAMRMMRQSLVEMSEGDGAWPRLPHSLRSQANGQIIVPVLPRTLWDRLLFRGVRGEVWLEPGVMAAEARYTLAEAYQDPTRQGKVALVLGAGNAAMLPVIDTLHKLFVENQVVILKPNPVNAYLGPLIATGLEPLIQRGFLRLVYGGLAEGDYLCHHPLVEELHLTGSAKTYEAITFGSGSEGAKRKIVGDPTINKRFTAELGNISPVIIVPGPWRESDLQNQAEQLVTWFVANAGFGCLTPRMIIQAKNWPLRQAFIEAIARVLTQVATRPAYYPGAHQIHAQFLDAYPQARKIGLTQPDHLPWTLITDVDPEQPETRCFRQEPFCSLMAETALDAKSVPDFLEQAVAFANHTLWGTLNATLIVHPQTQKENAAAIAQAIADLRYGAITVNMAAFSAYYFGVTPWGAFPGHTVADIQSGVGKTANFLLLARPQKSVIQGAFHPWPDPLRVTARNAYYFARQLALFEAAPSWRKLPGLLWAVGRNLSL